MKASTSIGRRIDRIKDHATQKLFIFILVSWALVPEEASTGVQDPTYTSASRNDVFTKIWSMSKLLCDEDVEGRGVGSPGAADCSSTTAFVGADDSLLEVLLSLKESLMTDCARMTLVQSRYGARAMLVFFIFIAQ